MADMPAELALVDDFILPAPPSFEPSPDAASWYTCGEPASGPG